MNYLKISSVSTTNAIDMFTLGVSTSRGNDSKIGQFGSGCLMATLLWLRLYGVSPIFMINGRRVEFTCKPERTATGGTFRRIFMNEDDVISPMSVALEYGEIDWRTHEMALREFISNAIDQNTDIVESMETTSEIGCDPSKVEVYIPMNPDVTRYWHSIDKYFLHFNRREREAVLTKDKSSNCRVYRRGVFIRELETPSLFDYNLDFDINESRNGSSDSMEREICRLCGGFNTKAIITKAQMKTILYDAINNKNSKNIELETPTRYGLNDLKWKEIAKEVAGSKQFTIISDNNNIKLPGQWYSSIIYFCPELDGLLNVSAVRKSTNLIAVPPGKDTMDIAKSLWEKLDLLSMTNGKAFPDVELYKTRNGVQPHACGMYHGNTISIWVDHATSRQTILEELLHHASGYEDNTRSFQEFIIRSLTEAVSLI